MEVQASMGVPPTEELTNPTGTPSFWCKSRPKKYAVAEKVPTVSGEQISQAPVQLDCGSRAGLGCLGLSTDGHGHFFTGVGPSPDGNADVTLQDHVIGDDLWKTDVGTDGGSLQTHHE